MTYRFDKQTLVRDFEKTRLKRSNRSIRIGNGYEPQPMSLRDVALETGIHFATLGRLVRMVGTPDTDTLLAVCAWMESSPKKYFVVGSK